MAQLTEEQLEIAVGHLERLMKARELKQTKLQELSGVSQSSISKILSKELVPTEDVLKKLFEGMGLRLRDVLEAPGSGSDELIGYLATPLTGVVDDPIKDKTLHKFVEDVKTVAAKFDEPSLTIYWPGDYTHPVKHPDVASEKVYLIDRSRASSYDFIILLCASPSYGVGQENEIATQAGLPGIRLIPDKVSRMITGSFLDAEDIRYYGSLETGIDFDKEKFEAALATVRKRHFNHRALFKDLNGQDFGNRLRNAVNSRASSYEIFANEIGVNLSYVHALMEEPLTVSNPSPTFAHLTWANKAENHFRGYWSVFWLTSGGSYG